MIEQWEVGFYILWGGRCLQYSISGHHTWSGKTNWKGQFTGLDITYLICPYLPCDEEYIYIELSYDSRIAVWLRTLLLALQDSVVDPCIVKYGQETNYWQIVVYPTIRNRCGFTGATLAHFCCSKRQRQVSGRNNQRLHRSFLNDPRRPSHTCWWKYWQCIGIVDVGGICLEHETKQRKKRKQTKIVVIVIVIVVIIIPEKISNLCKITTSVHITRCRQKKKK